LRINLIDCCTIPSSLNAEVALSSLKDGMPNRIIALMPSSQSVCTSSIALESGILWIAGIDSIGSGFLIPS
jgi:hypothetical protein